MKIKFITILITLVTFTTVAFAQTSWLDRPVRNWNSTSNVPTAPRAAGDVPSNAQCRTTVRIPESIADRAVTRAGWSLFGAAQTYTGVTLINGMASVDGMCRPMQYNTFVFVGTRFAGTLSPDVMDSRTDGALSSANLNDSTNISADFSRYTTTDAMCCPSQTSTVSYEVSGSRVQAKNISTKLACQTEQDPEPVDPNSVTGTVTSRGRMTLPRNSILTVRLVDITRQNTFSVANAEQRIDLDRLQAPYSFLLKFEERDISFRNNYAVEAEISSGGRILYKNDSVYRVLTQGNPNKAEIFLVPIVGSEIPTDSILRGTVSYRERIALANNAEVSVKLLDVSTNNVAGDLIAEDKFVSNARQVPLSFELRYNKNQIDSRRRYVVRAEIMIDGKLAFRSETDFAVLTQGNPTSNIDLTLVVAKVEATVITGREFNGSKFGTGTYTVEGRANELLIRASVRVTSDGKADVTVSPIGSGITFSGNLTYADDNTLRITVSKSGDADASGEIEVKYSSRRLGTIVSKDLVLDGQKASISF
jgi:uncharacterized lipoprotein YbaY